MKNAAEYTQRIRKLLSGLRKDAGQVALDPVDNPMDQLLLGILSNYASESRAHAVLQKLKEAMVDLNELRVTPIAEIVQIIGTSYPQCRPAAEEISATLGALFNRTHELSLDFLKQWPRKATNSFLDDLDVISPHAKAALVFRCLGGHAIPLDAAMYRYLRKADCIPEDADVEKAQKFLATRIKEREATEFYVLFKRYAASHAPRRARTPKKKAHPKKPARQSEGTKSSEATQGHPAGEIAPASSRRKTATLKKAVTKAARKMRAQKASTTSKSRPAKKTSKPAKKTTSSKTSKTKRKH